MINSSDKKTQQNNQQTEQDKTNQNNDDKNNTNSNNSDNNTSDNSNAFLMAIEDVYDVTGKGTTVTGSVERGLIKVGDSIQIIGLNHEIVNTTVIDITRFREQLDYADVGDNVGITLKDVASDDIEIGQVLAQPDSIEAAKKFDAEVYLLSKEEGGRHIPLFNNYRPDFYFRTVDIPGVITLPNDVKEVNPGENTTITVELDYNVAMEKGVTFSIREGGRVVGKGTITKIY